MQMSLLYYFANKRLIKRKEIMKGETKQTIDYLHSLGIDKPEIAIILGTGLGGLVDFIEIEKIVNYGDIPHFPVSTVEFHKGKLIYGNLCNKKVLVMQGRFHYYEGYNMKQITFPIQIMKALKVKWLFVSNAGGTVNPDFKKGDLMLIVDHINLFWDSPLIGRNDDSIGPRFVDMSDAYSSELNDLFLKVAAKEQITLHRGIYTAVCGSSLETRAEYRYLRFIGADVVGMSTIPEVIACKHANLPVAAISVITDECDPDNLEPIDIDDILKTAADAEVNLITLFKNVLIKMR